MSSCEMGETRRRPINNCVTCHRISSRPLGWRRGVCARAGRRARAHGRYRFRNGKRHGSCLPAWATNPIPNRLPKQAPRGCLSPARPRLTEKNDVRRPRVNTRAPHFRAVRDPAETLRFGQSGGNLISERARATLVVLKRHWSWFAEVSGELILESSRREASRCHRAWADKNLRGRSRSP